MSSYNAYFNYTLPQNWCAEEEGDNLLLYNPNGEGAIVISFFTALQTKESLTEQVSVLAKNCVDQNNIKLRQPFMLHIREDKSVLYGIGTTPDDWFVKLWVVAKYPKIVLATYQSQSKRCGKEVKVCDAIIDSFRFTF